MKRKLIIALAVALLCVCGVSTALAAPIAEDAAIVTEFSGEGGGVVSPDAQTMTYSTVLVGPALLQYIDMRIEYDDGSVWQGRLNRTQYTALSGGLYKMTFKGTLVLIV